jgi:hypothetical protein
MTAEYLTIAFNPGVTRDQLFAMFPTAGLQLVKYDGTLIWKVTVRELSIPAELKV